MSSNEKRDLLRAYFAGQWMVAMALRGDYDVTVEDCWSSADAMLGEMEKPTPKGEQL